MGAPTRPKPPPGALQPHFLGGVNSNLIASITITGDAWCRATDKTYGADTPAAPNFLDDYIALP